MTGVGRLLDYYPALQQYARVFNVRYGTFLMSTQVQMQVGAHFVKDVLRGDDTTEMRITLLKYIEDELPPDDE
jgi:hypothetical protein